MQRPMGVTILAVLAAIGGVLGICGSLAVVVGGSFLGFFGAAAGAAGATAAGGVIFIYGFVLLALSVAELVFAYGAWTLKPWAWMLGLVLAGLNVVWTLVAVVIGWTSLDFTTIIGLAINGVIIYYLNTADVKQAFGRA